SQYTIIGEELEKIIQYIIECEEFENVKNVIVTKTRVFSYINDGNISVKGCQNLIYNENMVFYGKVFLHSITLIKNFLPTNFDTCSMCITGIFNFEKPPINKSFIKNL